MGFGTKDFISKVKTGGFGKMSDWKRKGRTIGWIHKDGFRERRLHNMMPAIVKSKDGERVSQRMFVCSGDDCPLCALVEWAKQEVESLKEDTDLGVIYKTIKAKEKRDPDKVISYSLRELAGGGDWRRKMTPSLEFLFGWIPRDDRNADQPVEIMQSSVGLANAIKHVIQSQIEDRGERKGDPLTSPYAFKFTYRKDETPARMFNAERVDEDIAPLDEDVQEILGTPLTEFGIDLEKMTQVTDPNVMLDSIADAWDEECPRAFEDFEEFYKSAVGGRDEKTEREKRMDNARGRRDEMHGRSRDVARERGSDDGKAGRKVAADEDSPPVSRREPGRGEQRRRRGAESEPVDEKPSGRRRAEPEPAEDEPPAPASSRRRREPEEDAPSGGKGGLQTCPECGEKVKPSPYGKCPECAAELDVPF